MQCQYRYINGEVVEQIERLIDLGSIVYPPGGVNDDVKARVNKARAAYAQLKPVYCNNPATANKNQDLQFQRQVSFAVWMRDMAGQNTSPLQLFVKKIFAAYSRHLLTTNFLEFKTVAQTKRNPHHTYTKKSSYKNGIGLNIRLGDRTTTYPSKIYTGG